MARADGRRSRTLLLLVLAAAYSLGAATTTPFSGPADAVTAAPIVAVVALAVVRWPLHPTCRARRPSVAGESGRAGCPRHPFRAWVVLFAVVVAFELLEYFARGSRGAHPTLSSMADAIDRREGLKALVVFGWLCLGAAIVRAGAAARRPDGAAGGVRR